MPGQFSEASGCAACALLVLELPVLMDTSNTPIRSPPRCWSPHGLFRMAQGFFLDCFPMLPMPPISVKPAFCLT